MKLNKFFMLGLAGLAFAACSNEENLTGKNLDGNGVVSVKIVSPQSRTVISGTDKEEIIVGKEGATITVELTASEGGGTQDVEFNGGSHTVKFYGVKNPTKVEAYINDGKNKGQGTTDIAEIQVTPEQIPAYGSTEEIHLNGTTETSDGKTYEMYEAAVTMQIPVARLEVSGIKHVTHPTDDGEEENCKYQTLSIDGIYLDKIKTTSTGSVQDYAMGKDIDETNPKYPVLSDKITSTSFLAANASWPAEEGMVYAYNFYPGNMPILKIYFENAEGVDADEILSEPRYAVIQSYNGDSNFDFKAGTVYRIKDVSLKDKNIIGDEEGNILYGVDVTVTEAKWTALDITSEWIEQ